MDNEKRESGLKVPVVVGEMRVDPSVLKLRMPEIELVVKKDDQHTSAPVQPAAGCGPCNVTQTVTAGGPSTAVVLGVLGAILLIALILIWFASNQSKPSQEATEQPKQIYRYENGKISPLTIIFSFFINESYAKDKVIKIPENSDKIMVVDDKAEELAAAEKEKLSLKQRVKTLEEEKSNLQQEVVALKPKASTSAALRSQLQEKEKKLGEVVDQLTALKNDLQKKEIEIEKLQLKLDSGLDLAKENNKAEKEKLDKYLTVQKPSEWNFFLPLEDPVAGMVRQKCPDGTVPKYYKFGENVSFSCQASTFDKLTEPAKPNKTCISKYAKCLVWAGVGGAGGSAGNYGIGRATDREVNAEDWIIGGLVGGAAGYGLCVLFSSDCEE